MNLDVIKDRVLEAVAIAAFIGGGAQLISNTVVAGKHDSRISAVERLNENVEALRLELTETKLILIEYRLNQSMEQKNDKSE